MTTLYKLTPTSLLSWSITTEVHKVIIEHGQYRGQKQVEILPFSSATLAETEKQRRIHIKVTKQGYTEEIPETIPQLPMLASIYCPSKLEDYVYIQPKLDGIRCVASHDTMRTRRGEPIESLPHITVALRRLPPGVRLDGELYCHNLSFQEHLSLVKRHTPHPDSHQILYYVFDIQANGPFRERLFGYRSLVDQLQSPYIRAVTCPIHCKDEIDIVRPLYSNYEGVILRNPSGPYLWNQRSPDLQKYKWKNMEECQVVDMTCATTGREAGRAIYICELNGVRFKARPLGNLEILKVHYKYRDVYQGWWTRITFEGLSKEGVPLKPRAQGLTKTREELQ